MNQEKIGKFISERRKEKGITQKQLAEKLNITDRAISKWENGRSLPDVMIMLDLCKELEISVNDLLNGEIVIMHDYKEKTEQMLIEIIKQKEESDKKLLFAEVLISIMAIVPLIICIIIGIIIPKYIQIEEWKQAMIILVGMIPLLIVIPFLLRIEQIAGYYQCSECDHKYVPNYKNVFLAPHIGRTRYMKCPKCQKKSWQTKIIKK